MINDWIHSFLELIAMILIINSIFFAQKKNIYLYPFKVLSILIYSFLNYRNFLYGNFIIHMYFMMIGLFGWYLWSNFKTISISFCCKRDYFHTLILFIFTCIFNLIVHYFTNNRIIYQLSWIDLLKNGLYLSGMYQMSLKKVENWIFWMIVNFLSISIYFFQGLIFTGILFIIFFILSVEGFLIWRNEANLLRKNN